MFKLRLCALFIVAAAAVYLDARAADKDEKKGTVVKLAELNLSSTAPAKWKSEESAKSVPRMLAQFTLPKIEGEDDAAEVAVSRGGSATAKTMVSAWKHDFSPPEGKEMDDVAKVTELKVSDLPVAYLDVHGTYNGPPWDSKFKGKKMANFRLVGVIFEVKGAPPYLIRFLGPEKAVERSKKDFDEWVKAFK